MKGLSLWFISMATANASCVTEGRFIKLSWGQWGMFQTICFVDSNEGLRSQCLSGSWGMAPAHSFKY